MTLLLRGTLIALLLLAPSTAFLRAESDQELLQGTWVVAFRMTGGMQQVINEREPMTFLDDQLTEFGRPPPAEVRGTIPLPKTTFKLDETTTPKQIDLIRRSEIQGKTVDFRLSGIYEMKGDKLRLSMVPPNQPRPTTFLSKPGSPDIIMVLQREQKQVRTWTDATGKYQLEASIEGLQNETVVLRRADKTVVRLGLDRLSKEDQQYARNWQSIQASAPNESNKLREWVDVTGKFKLRAELVTADQKFVDLKATNGKITRIPIAKLSEADQVFLRQADTIDTKKQDAIAYFKQVGARYTPTQDGLHSSLSLRDARIPRQALARVEDISDLHILSIDNLKLRDDDLAHLANLPELSKLSLNIREITGEGLSHLQGLESLAELTLSGTTLRNENLAHVAKLSQLWYLDLSHTPIDNAGLSHLGNMPLLRTLILFKTKITDAGLAHLTKLPALNSLNLSYTSITDCGMKSVEEIGTLQFLNVEGTPVTDRGLKHLAGCERLLGLDLTGTKITDQGLQHLAGLSELRDLNLIDAQVSHVGIAKLEAALPNTRIAHNAAANAEEAKAIAHFESLGPGTFVRHHKMLMLYLRELSQQDLDAMSKIVDLKTLTLAESNIEDAGLAVIAHQDKLVSLELFDTSISDAGLIHLKELSALMNLTLRKTAITDAGLIHLEGLKKLGVLDLRFTKVTQAGVKRLQEALPKCDIRFQDE